MADGVWYINDNADVIDPGSYVSGGRATIRIRRAERNYAFTGNSTRVTLWARANSPVSGLAVVLAQRERSSDPLPSDVPRPAPTPTPHTPPAGSVPIPSGAPPYPYAMVVWDSKNNAWIWVAVELTPAPSGSGTFPSLATYPSLGLYPSA